MRLSRLSILLLPLLLLLPPGVSGAGPEAAYQSARADYHILKNSARKQLFRENWLQVIDGLVDFQKSYPSQRRAPDALYLAGKAAEGLYQVSRVADDARLAVSHFDRVAELYPGDNLADDALFLAGGLLETPLKEPAEAYQRYLSIVQGHPGGDMFAQAQVKLRDLAVYAPKARSESSGQAATGPARLEEVRFWTNEGYTRVVLDLDRPVEFTSNQLAAKPMEQVPSRIYLDLAGIDPNLPVPQTVNIDDGVVRQIRAGRPAPDVMRVVLDLDNSGEFRIFALSQPFRLVIDIAAAPAAEAPARQPELRKPPGAGDRIGSILDRTPKETPLRVQIPERRGNGGLRRVVVDAGHGGKDPGAIGPSGVLEKDVALAIARELARRIEKELGCEVIMTRDRDVFIPLQERTALANKIDADLFISVHANASPNSSAYGIETYYLNFSKNDQAVAVAARENGTTLKEVGDLELILFDLMANSKINESSRLAAEIQNSLVEQLKVKYSAVKDLGVRPGPFHVLLGATMPSVLVEAAFISNRREEDRLTDRRYQQQTADAIIEGVKRYARAFKLIAAN